MRVSFPKTAACIRFVVLAVWILAIVWLSLTSKPPNPDLALFGYDKLLHATTYCSLTLLAGWAFAGITTLSGRIWLMLAASAVLISGMLEVAQALFTATRTAEAGDLVANGIGATLAVLLTRITTKSRTRGQ